MRLYPWQPETVELKIDCNLDTLNAVLRQVKLNLPPTQTNEDPTMAGQNIYQLIASIFGVPADMLQNTPNHTTQKDTERTTHHGL